MSELQKARQLVERAEQAAMSGNFAAADELLKEAARIQEKELGPGHPDLANTLNNLAIVAEKTGRAGEAEPLYRRAARIAAAALPPDHPMVVESRQNLADFCLAHGVSVENPPATTPVADDTHDHVATVIAPEVPAALPKPPTGTPKNASRSLPWLVGVAAVVVVVVVLVVWRPRSSPDTPASVTASEPQTEPPSASIPPPTTAQPGSSATQRKESSTATVPDRNRQVITAKPSAAGAVTLAVAEVCRSFSTSGGTWHCEPVGSSVRPGPIVLYTRVKSPRDTAVVHRWYRGNTLRQSVKLAVHGNATEGYRTYSRQTVRDGDWRVEVRSADGALLHEQRFVVR